MSYTETLDLTDPNARMAVVHEFAQRMLVRPTESFISHSAAQQVMLSTTCRGVVLAGGGNQSGKTTVLCVKAAAIAEDSLRNICCPRECLCYGRGSCGIHCCPGPERGGTVAPDRIVNGVRYSCTYGQELPCPIHVPLQMQTPRLVYIVGDKHEKLHGLIYAETMRQYLPKTLSGAYKFREPNKDKGVHFVEALDKSWRITFLSTQEGKDAVRSLRGVFFGVDELPSHDVFRELKMRIVRFNGQIMIAATHDALLDDKVAGQYIFTEIVDRKDQSIQVISLSSLDNHHINQEALASASATMSPEERAIRVNGSFGYRSSRCAFSSFALDRQRLNIKTPMLRYIHGSFAPIVDPSFETYFAGETRFPTGCTLDMLNRQILLEERKVSGRGGEACVDCVNICQKYKPPPVRRPLVKPAPSLSERPVRNPNGDETPSVRLYDMPKPNCVCIAAADIARGVKGGDNSVLLIVNAITGDEILELCGPFRVRDFAYYSYGILQLFGFPLLVAEENGPGAQYIELMQNELQYPRMWADPERKRTLPSGSQVNVVGFLTTNQSKRERLVKGLESMMVQGMVSIHTKEAIDEMQNFIRDDGKLNGISGSKDDRVITWGLIGVGWESVDRRSVLSPTVKLDEIPYGTAKYFDVKFQKEYDAEQRLKELDTLNDYSYDDSIR